MHIYRVLHYPTANCNVDYIQRIRLIKTVKRIIFDTVHWSTIVYTYRHIYKKKSFLFKK